MGLHTGIYGEIPNPKFQIQYIRFTRSGLYGRRSLQQEFSFDGTGKGRKEKKMPLNMNVSRKEMQSDDGRCVQHGSFCNRLRLASRLITMAHARRNAPS